MPFCWLDENDTSERQSTGAERTDATETEIREKASLMKRLGHPKADAVHRCMGNVAWAFSVSGQPAVTPARIRKIVSLVYGKAS